MYDHVLDFRALVKTEAAHDAILHVVPAKLFLQRARQEVRPEKDRHARARIRLLVMQETVGHIHGLFLGVGRFHVRDQVARRILRPERLAFAHFIVRDDGARGCQNGLCRPVVLLEPDRADPRIVLLKRKNVLNVGAAPTVDGLVFIADNADVLVDAREVADQPVLLPIRVLGIRRPHAVLELRAV